VRHRQNGVVEVTKMHCNVGAITSSAQRRSPFDKFKPTRLRRPRGPPMEENTPGSSWRAIVPQCDRNGRGGALAFLWQHGVFVGLIVQLICKTAAAIHVAVGFPAVVFHVKACSSRFSTNRTLSRPLLGTKVGLGDNWLRGKDWHFAAISRRVDNGRLHVVATLKHLPALPFFHATSERYAAIGIPTW
jgi:hypothetical protein